MLSCLKFRTTKGWGGARLLLVGGAFLVLRTLRIEAAAIRGGEDFDCKKFQVPGERLPARVKLNVCVNFYRTKRTVQPFNLPFYTETVQRFLQTVGL